MKQQVFDLLKINRQATKDAVERALENYRVYLWTIEEPDMPTITQTYSIVPPSSSGVFNSKTETAAIQHAEIKQQRDTYMRRIESCVNRLSKIERQVITKKYMCLNEEYDYTIYNELHISETHYYRIRSRAFYKLAFALRLEVYEL